MTRMLDLKKQLAHAPEYRDDGANQEPMKSTVKVDLSRLYKGIDLPETLSNLTGKRIRRIKPDSVEFEDGTVIDLTKQDFDALNAWLDMRIAAGRAIPVPLDLLNDAFPTCGDVIRKRKKR